MSNRRLIISFPMDDTRALSPSTYKPLHARIHPIQSNKISIRRKHLQAGILHGSYLA